MTAAQLSESEEGGFFFFFFLGRIRAMIGEVKHGTVH